MAIISGMEAAKVDDVKPFEMPIDQMAMGIAKRQERADTAKKAYADAAAATNFEVRDREQDYAEKQKLIDSFNNDIAKIEEDAGGDWSQIDNSQIQSAAVRMTQNKMYGHLVFHKKQADEYEKIAKELEKTHGFVERFGDNAVTSDLFDKDGNIRDATKWSLQAKLDHVSAAHDYYKDVGHNLKEKFDLIHSSDETYNKMTPAQKDQLWYDFWVNKDSSHKDNIYQIDQIKNFLIEDYKQTDAGKQYYQILLRDNKNAGMDDATAKISADKSVFDLVQRIGASKYIIEDKTKGSLQMNNKPQEPGPRSFGPGRNSSGVGDDKDKYEIPMNNSTFVEVTAEGYSNNFSTFADAASAITDDNFNMDAIPDGYVYSQVGNVKAVGQAATLVRHRRGEKKDGIAKNVGGFNYVQFEPLDDTSHANKYGNNPTAANIYNGGNWASMLSLSPEAMKRQVSMGLLSFQNDPSLAVEFSDIEKGVDLMLDQTLAKDKVYQGLSPKEKGFYRNSKKAELIHDLNGTDGDVAAMHTATYHDDLGYSTYSIKDEYKYIQKAIDNELAKISKMPDGEGKTLALKYANLKKERLTNKIKQSEAGLVLLNTPISQAVDLDLSPAEMQIVRNSESQRAYTKSLKIQADNLLMIDKAIMQQCNLSDVAIRQYKDPESITDPSEKALVLKDKESITKARTNALAKTLGMEPTIGYGMTSQLADIVKLANDPTSQNVYRLAAKLAGYDNDHINKYIDDTKRTAGNLHNVTNKVLNDLVSGKISPELLNSVKMPSVEQAEMLWTIGKQQLFGDRGNGAIESRLFYYMLNEAGIDLASIKENSTTLYKQIFDIADMVYKAEQSQFDWDPSKKGLVARPVDRTKLNIELSSNMKAEILKSGARENYKNYIAMTDDSKKAFHQTTGRYNVNIGTKEGAAIHESVRHQTGITLLSLFDQNNQIKDNFLKARLVNYDKDGTYEYVDINGEQMTAMLNTIGQRDDKGKLKDPLAVQQYLTEKAQFMGLRPDFYNDVGQTGDGSYVGHFINADVMLTYDDPKTGKQMLLQVEIPMPNIDIETALSMGMDNSTVEYGQQCAAGMTGSGNVNYKLTAPSSKDTDTPISKNFHVLNFPAKIAGKQYQKGAVIVIHNENPDIPLYDQLATIRDGEFEHFDNFEKSFKWFHSTYEEPMSKGLQMSIGRIDKMEADYAKYKGNPLKMEALMRSYDGDKAWNAYLAAGQDFNKMRAEAVRINRQKMHDKNPAKLESTALKDSKYSVTALDRQGYSDLTLRDANKTVISESEILAMAPQDLSNVYSASEEYKKKTGKSDASFSEVRDILKQNAEGKIDTKIDGEYYMLTKDNYTSVGDKSKSYTSKFRPEVGLYTLYESGAGISASGGVTFGGEKKVVAVAKTGAPAMLNKEASAGFEKFLSFAHADMKLAEPFEISSTTRSINSNLAVYKKDLKSLTNSDHFTGHAIDISVGTVTTGENLWKWCETNGGTSGKLKEMGIYVLRHKTNDGDDHLHIAYVGPNHPKAGIVQNDIDKALGNAKTEKDKPKK